MRAQSDPSRLVLHGDADDGGAAAAAGRVGLRLPRAYAGRRALRAPQSPHDVRSGINVNHAVCRSVASQQIPIVKAVFHL